MILKIRTNDLVKGTGIGWYLIDNIKSLSYEYMDKEKAIKQYEKDGGDESATTMAFERFKDCKTCRVCRIITNFRDGTGKVIYVDDIVFILNDEGKTADKIYG